MDEMSPALPIPHSPDKSDARRRGAVSGLIVIGAATVLVLINGGRPASIWFYPYIAALGLIGGYRQYRDKSGGKPQAIPGESKRRSAEIAVLQGAILGVSVYVLSRLASEDPAYTRSWFAIPPMLAYAIYCNRRGRKSSFKVTLLIVAASLALFAAFLEYSRR